MHRLRTFSAGPVHTDAHLSGLELSYDLQMRGVGVVLLPVAVMACTHERPITELHEVAGERVIVETYSHERVQATAIRGPAGVTFANDGGVLAPASVAKVTEVRHGRGAAEGGGIGFLVGAAVGATMGYLEGDDQCPPEGWCLFEFTATDKAVLGAASIGVVGGLVGLLFGGANGSHYVYSYGDQVRVTPTGPPGSMGGVTIKY